MEEKKINNNHTTGNSSPSSGDLQSLFSRAFTSHQSGDFVEAEQLYGLVLAQRPDNVNLLCNMGILCRDMGKHDAALLYIKRARDIDPGNPLIYLNLGAVHEAEGDLNQAETSYRKALLGAPMDPRIMNNLGKVLHMQGKLDEGLEFLQQAVRLMPDYPLALNNLGVVLSALGRTEEAVVCFKKAHDGNPDDCDILFNLAGAYNAVENFKDARVCYEKTLFINPQHDSARHMLCSLTGGRSGCAPASYVIDTFDRYAHRFDSHLTEKLEYRIPQKLREALLGAAGDRFFTNGLDLGCGTGLSGQAFQELAEKLTGVDLSTKMLQKAAGKNIYHRLVSEDVVAFLKSCDELFDLVIAADLFIYIGELDRLFQMVHDRTSDDAFFVFSIERAEDGCRDYELRVSGRYAQSIVYIERLAEEFGFVIDGNLEENIRKEQGKWIGGNIFVLRKG
ncbi:MAG: tetratricopeptide repeat protein [Pseudomonadota bacterium]